MTIPYKITLGKDLNEKQKSEITALLEEVFSLIDTIYNPWNPESEISLLNKSSADKVSSISQELFDFLQKINPVIEATDFLFDPTVAPLCTFWKQQQHFPSEERIISILECVGWKNIHFNQTGFWKNYSQTAIDLCGIAKGYCVDLIVDRLKNNGYTHGLVEWGGELKAFGNHPLGRPWKIVIAPINFEQSFVTIELHEEAVATSGDTWNYWEWNEKKYCHIIHPKTGMPQEIHKNSIASVTVITKDAFLADALATALMLFPCAEEAEAFGKLLQIRFPNMRFWIQTHIDTRSEK